MDFFGYRPAMIQRRIDQRLPLTNCKDIDDYFSYLKKTPLELDILIDSLTINVSEFFRDPLMFEYLAAHILPALFKQKKKHQTPFLRIWSSGCAMGEEPYSIAMLLNDGSVFEKQTAHLNMDVTIFATDIDKKIIKKARKAVYSFESIKNVKYGLVEKNFLHQGNDFHLLPFLKEQISFSVYDILDPNSYAPPESIFGNFDMVFCRNMLIYFNTQYQETIFEKLYRSLSLNGYLILGEAEVPPMKYQNHFRKVNECCHIYQKNQ